jgi:UDP-2-acetamido-2,6-beta-L-arabino-hexul-4-ose reductase
MLTVGITGANGLLGWHLRCALRERPEFCAVAADRSTFASEQTLQEFAASSDVIVHFAGMNRGDDSEIYQTNVELTERLICAVLQSGKTKQIIFSSSAHIELDTAYGRSKRRCSQMLQSWASANGTVFTDIVLCNVFGEGGRPFYNSAVSTFCHQLASHQCPEVKNDIEMTLLHAQRVADIIIANIGNQASQQLRPKGASITVSSLLAKLSGAYDQYEKHVIPDLRNNLDLDLFNTLRSYLYPGHYPVQLCVHADARGFLFEAVKSHHGGQSFVSSTVPDIVRGNHFHRRKVERFLVVNGTAEIRVRKLFGEQADTFKVKGGEPAYIDIPTLHTHNIRNTGESELTTLFWAHEMFDPSNPDTIAEAV